MKEDAHFEYDFNLKEVQSLIRLLRSHEQTLHPELEPFMAAVEHFIYDSMTIDEAETFF